MIKRIITFLLATLILFTGLESSAIFFKKSKGKKKETVKQTQVKEEKSKVLLVQIFASWCPGCKNVQPTLDQLSLDNSDFEFVRLDVSTPSKAKVSAKKAEELKIGDFYAANKSKTATIAVIVPSTKEIISVFQNNTDIEDYLEAIKKAKEKEEVAVGADEKIKG